MTRYELTVMDGGKCILQLRSVRPFLSDKYDITKHPSYISPQPPMTETLLIWRSS